MRTAYLSLTPVVLCLALSASAAEKPARLDAAGDPLPDGAVARLGTARFRTGESLGVVAMSPDGKVLAVCGDDWVIRLLDATTGKPLRRIEYDTLPPSLTFSPDGKQLAVASWKYVQLYDTATGRAGRKLAAPPAQVSAVVFSGDGKFVCGSTAKAADKVPMPVWETATGKLVASLPTWHGRPLDVALSVDGKLLAVSGQLQGGADEKTPPEEAARTIQLWDVAKGKELRRLVAEHGSFGGVAISPDGKTVAAMLGACTLTFWDVATGKEVRRFATRRGVGTSLLYSPDGKYLAGGGDDGSVLLWDAATGKRLGRFDGPPGSPARPCFPAAGRALAYGYTDRAVVIYDLLAGKFVTPAEGHTECVQGLAFRDRGKELVSATYVGGVCVWDAVAGKELRRVQQRLDPDDEIIGRSKAGNVTLSPDGRQLLTNVFGEGCLCDAATGKTSLTLEDGGVGLFAFSADGSRFAAAKHLDLPRARTSGLRVYETATGRQVHELAEGFRPTAIAFAPDGKLLAVVTSDGGNAPAGVSAWDLATGKLRWQDNHPKQGPQPLAFAPDGKLLACGGEAGSLTLYESATGRALRALTTPNAEALTAVRFSPDGRLVAAGYTTSGHKPPRLRVWELATDTVRDEFIGHAGEILTLCFTPDGKRLASGSADTTVLLWDLTGRAGAEAPKEKPGAAELDKLWAALADLDARPAHRAMSRLEASPQEAVALLAKQVKPVEATKTDAAAIARLIAALDAENFEEREKAGKELEALGRGAEPALRKALAGRPSAEAKRRIEELLEKLKDKGGPRPESVRLLRAVEVLEHLATPEARKLLESLAKGAADSPLTTAAAEALARLQPGGQ
jgi:WD40 repeat protein